MEARGAAVAGSRSSSRTGNTPHRVVEADLDTLRSSALPEQSKSADDVRDCATCHASSTMRLRSAVARLRARTRRAVPITGSSEYLRLDPSLLASAPFNRSEPSLRLATRTPPELEKLLRGIQEARAAALELRVRVIVNLTVAVLTDTGSVHFDEVRVGLRLGPRGWLSSTERST